MQMKMNSRCNEVKLLAAITIRFGLGSISSIFQIFESDCLKEVNLLNDIIFEVS